jgi:hypothetical protein
MADYRNPNNMTGSEKKAAARERGIACRALESLSKKL